MLLKINVLSSFLRLVTSFCEYRLLSTSILWNKHGRKYDENFCKLKQIVSSQTRNFIQVQNTPNPESLKFIPKEKVLEDGQTMFFSTKNDAKVSPLASINGVKAVMLGPNFITVNRDEKLDISWDILKPQIFSTINDFYETSLPVILDNGIQKKDDIPNEDENSEIIDAINELLESRIRPIILEDGGDIVFHSYDSSRGIVKLKLQGSCSNCPQSSITLRNGVRNMLKFYIPEVYDVEEVVDEPENDIGVIEFDKLEESLKKKIVENTNNENSSSMENHHSENFENEFKNGLDKNGEKPIN